MLMLFVVYVCCLFVVRCVVLRWLMCGVRRSLLLFVVCCVWYVVRRFGARWLLCVVSCLMFVVCCVLFVVCGVGCAVRVSC